MIRKYLSAAIALGMMAVVSDAQAVPVTYTFTGTMSGLADLGGGIVGFTDAAVTITGMTLDDTDVDPTLGVGLYSAMSTYSISGIGDFVTDGSTGEYYVQGDDFVSIILVGLVDASFSTGFITGTGPGIVPGVADLGAVPLGGPLVSIDTLFSPRILTNGAGHGLFFTDIEIVEFSVFEKAATTAAVPEPAALVLFGLGLAGMGCVKRRPAN